MWELRTGTVEQTRALGVRLGEAAQPGTVIALVGPLGSGKTALAQGIGRGLEVVGPVQSPTFVVVQAHEEGRLPLFHADLYRVERPEELEQIGLEDLIDAGGVVLIEWADLHPSILPADHLEVRLDHAQEGRTLQVVAHGPAHAALWERARG
jgi:tRNA threonylcarbamoyladenosine biosynthesis protein TsaE